MGGNAFTAWIGADLLVEADGFCEFWRQRGCKG